MHPRHDNYRFRTLFSKPVFPNILRPLSRLRSFQGLLLLEKITLNDLRFSPGPELIMEMDRLRALEAKTLAAWA